MLELYLQPACHGARRPRGFRKALIRIAKSIAAGTGCRPLAFRSRKLMKV
jgi:hypothetical protein